MNRIREEAEVVARLDFLTQETHITVVSWPAMAKRMTRLYGKPLDPGQQVQRWRVKGLLVGFRKPRKVGGFASASRENRRFSMLSPSDGMTIH